MTLVLICASQHCYQLALKFGWFACARLNRSVFFRSCRKHGIARMMRIMSMLAGMVQLCLYCLSLLFVCLVTVFFLDSEWFLTKDLFDAGSFWSPSSLNREGCRSRVNFAYCAFFPKIGSVRGCRGPPRSQKGPGFFHKWACNGRPMGG